MHETVLVEPNRYEEEAFRLFDHALADWPLPTDPSSELDVVVRAVADHPAIAEVAADLAPGERQRADAQLAAHLRQLVAALGGSPLEALAWLLTQNELLDRAPIEVLPEDVFGVIKAAGRCISLELE